MLDIGSRPGAAFPGCPVDPCEAAKFNSIDYFSTQDFGINIQSSIFWDKNLTFLNNQVFFNPTTLNIKKIKYFSTQIFIYTTGQCQNIMTILICCSEQE